MNVLLARYRYLRLEGFDPVTAARIVSKESGITVTPAPFDGELECPDLWNRK